jgi:hypothetical protein
MVMNNTQLTKALYSEQEAANYFGWSIFTMRNIRRRGDIECLVFNDKTVRYTLEQLENYLNTNKRGIIHNDNNSRN